MFQLIPLVFVVTMFVVGAGAIAHTPNLKLSSQHHQLHHPQQPGSDKKELIAAMHRPGIEPGASRIDLKQMATANFTTKPPMLVLFDERRPCFKFYILVFKTSVRSLGQDTYLKSSKMEKSAGQENSSSVTSLPC